MKEGSTLENKVNLNKQLMNQLKQHFYSSDQYIKYKAWKEIIHQLNIDTEEVLIELIKDPDFLKEVLEVGKEESDLNWCEEEEQRFVSKHVVEKVVNVLFNMKDESIWPLLLSIAPGARGMDVADVVEYAQANSKGWELLAQLATIEHLTKYIDMSVKAINEFPLQVVEFWSVLLDEFYVSTEKRMYEEGSHLTGDCDYLLSNVNKDTEQTATLLFKSMSVHFGKVESFHIYNVFHRIYILGAGRCLPLIEEDQILNDLKEFKTNWESSFLYQDEIKIMRLIQYLSFAPPLQNTRSLFSIIMDLPFLDETMISKLKCGKVDFGQDIMRYDHLTTMPNPVFQFNGCGIIKDIGSLTNYKDSILLLHPQEKIGFLILVYKWRFVWNQPLFLSCVLQSSDLLLRAVAFRIIKHDTFWSLPTAKDIFLGSLSAAMQNDDIFLLVGVLSVAFNSGKPKCLPVEITVDTMYDYLFSMLNKPTINHSLERPLSDQSLVVNSMFRYSPSLKGINFIMLLWDNGDMFNIRQAIESLSNVPKDSFVQSFSSIVTWLISYGWETCLGREKFVHVVHKLLLYTPDMNLFTPYSDELREILFSFSTTDEMNSVEIETFSVVCLCILSQLPMVDSAKDRLVLVTKKALLLPPMTTITSDFYQSLAKALLYCDKNVSESLRMALVEAIQCDVFYCDSEFDHLFLVNCTIGLEILKQRGSFEERIQRVFETYNGLLEMDLTDLPNLNHLYSLEVEINGVSLQRLLINFFQNTLVTVEESRSRIEYTPYQGALRLLHAFLAGKAVA